jgi:putative transposase
VSPLQAGFALAGRNVVDEMNQLARERKLPHTKSCRSRTGICVQGARGVVPSSLREACFYPADRERSFNVQLRDERLNVNEFATLDDARQRLQTWRQDCNDYWPHVSGRMTPSEFASKGWESGPRGTETLVSSASKTDQRLMPESYISTCY